MAEGISDEDILEMIDPKELEAFVERIVALECGEGECSVAHTEGAQKVPEQHSSAHSIWEDCSLDTAVTKGVVEKAMQDVGDHTGHQTGLNQSGGGQGCQESDSVMCQKFMQLQIYSSSGGVAENEEPPSCQNSENYTENIPGTSKLKGTGGRPSARRSRKKSSDAREKPINCIYCGKSFKFVRNLKVHLRIHRGEKPYGCRLCGKHFRQLSHLKRHERVHTGEKPYVCPVCGKEFRNSSNMRTHQVVHKKDQPFSCSQCGKGFAYLGNVSRHMSIHLRENATAPATENEFLQFTS